MKKQKLDSAFAALVQALGRVQKNLKDEDSCKYAALRAVLAFLEDTIDSADLVRPLELLNSDLSYKLVAKSIRPRRGNSMSTYKIQYNALCLAAIDLLIRCGHTAKAAIEKVHKETSKTLSEAYLKNLRKNARRKKAGNDPLNALNAYYGNFIRFAGQCSTKDEAAQQMLEFVASPPFKELPIRHKV